MNQRNIIIVIILLLIFAFGIVDAESKTFATKNNKGGGMIVLTDIKCDSKPGLVAYSTAPSSGTIFGCWFYDESFVHILWTDGETRSYSKSGWTFPKSGSTYDEPRI